MPTLCSRAISRCGWSGCLRKIRISNAVPKSALGQAVQSLQVDEEELLGEGEILLQQAVTQEAAVGVRQNALGGRESHRLQAAGRAGRPARRPFAAGRARTAIAQRVQEQELVERVNGGALSVQVEAEGIEGQLLQAEPAQAFHANADHGGRVGRHAGRGETVHGRYRGAGDSQRPEGDRIAGAERADIAILRLAVDRRCRTSPWWMPERFATDRAETGRWPAEARA